MLYNKAQREIFNAMLLEKRAGKIAMEDGKFLITANGFVGWVFPQEVLQINIEKLRDIPAFTLNGYITTENKLEQTKDFILADERKNGMVRRYKKGRTSVFINPKYLEYFQNFTLYQKESPLGTIVVTEKQGRFAEEIIVGIVMPVRDNGSWAEHYAERT